MSYNDFITELLNLKEKNLEFYGNIEKTIKNKVQYNIVSAKLSYTPKCCMVCGVINENFNIIKNGTKISNIKILPINGYPSILRLRKQRYYCKECNHTFIAKTSIVDKNCCISKDVKNKIMIDLKKKISEKDIAQMNGVSSNTVTRAVDLNFTSFSPKKNYLPKKLLFDEFKSTRDAKGSMSFIFICAETHQIIDIVENRQLPYLIRYFSSFTKKARENVEKICIDMYSPYISLIKKCFPNAKIVIDRFHIVQMITRSFTKTRIEEMKKLNTSSMEYKRLKRYWKLFLKPQDKLNYANFRHYTHFRTWQSEKTLCDNALKISDKLYETYKAMQILLFDINNKNKEKLILHANQMLDTNISEHLKITIKSILKYSDYINNALDDNISNGAIEGINNYIKTFKRIAFGYKSFFHFRNRILISKNMIIPKIENMLA